MCSNASTGNKYTETESVYFLTIKVSYIDFRIIPFVKRSDMFISKNTKYNRIAAFPSHLFAHKLNAISSNRKRDFAILFLFF